MTVRKFKKWLIDNQVLDSAVILMAPAGQNYFDFKPEYDDDATVGEAVVIHFSVYD